MKPNKIILTPEGIKAIEAPHYRYPTHDNDWSNEEAKQYQEYKQALDKAIKEGVLFKHTETTAMAMGIHDGEFEQGKLYDIPEHYSIKIENNYAYLIPKQEHGAGNMSIQLLERNSLERRLKEQPTSIEEAAEYYYLTLSRPLANEKGLVETAFVSGATSEAAKEYWYQQFKSMKP